MPKLVRRREASAEIEEDILLNTILHTEFIDDIITVLNPDLFQKKYVKKVIRWCLDYYNQYEKAPEAHIEDIFITETDNLDPPDRRLIAKMLTKLDSISENRNQEYLADRAIKYLKDRSLLLFFERGKAYASAGKTERAEDLLNQYSSDPGQAVEWFDPIDSRVLRRVFDKSDENVMFSLDGALGDLVGPLERTHLFAILGPMKRGKTHWLQEMALNGAMNRYNVVFISLEMGISQVATRFYKQMTGISKVSGKKIVPILDCVWNQRGACEIPERENDIQLYDFAERKDPPPFREGMDYRPCTYCRETEPQNMWPAVWHETVVQRKEYSLQEVGKSINNFKRMWGNRLRFMSYPAFSASLSDIMRGVNALERVHNFVPDIMVIDYADILVPERNDLTGREALDNIWKTMRRIAQERMCLVVTASQTNRQAIDRRSIRATDTAEDIRKIAHVDRMMALNQTINEKRNNCMRVNVIADRHNYFDPSREVLVLQDYDRGQVAIDSEFLRRE